MRHSNGVPARANRNAARKFSDTKQQNYLQYFKTLSRQRAGTRLKGITDEKTGISYILHGDYYLPDLELPAQEEKRPIGIWGRRHLRYIQKHRKAHYTGLVLDGQLNGYLAELNEQAEDMFFRLVNELAEKEGITEMLKVADQMEWVRRMNAVRETATEIVNNDLIYA